MIHNDGSPSPRDREYRMACVYGRTFPSPAPEPYRLCRTSASWFALCGLLPTSAHTRYFLLELCAGEDILFNEDVDHRLEPPTVERKRLVFIRAKGLKTAAHLVERQHPPRSVTQ